MLNKEWVKKISCMFPPLFATPYIAHLPVHSLIYVYRCIFLLGFFVMIARNEPFPKSKCIVCSHFVFSWVSGQADCGSAPSPMDPDELSQLSALCWLATQHLRTSLFVFIVLFVLHFSLPKT